jgi:predicted thioesterase
MKALDLPGLKVGMEGTYGTIVSAANSAEASGYKGMPVLGTPHLVGLLEMACMFVHEALPGHLLTVGIANRMAHLAASPLGAEIISKARLVAIDGRKLEFHVEAHDPVEKIAEGTHVRFIVEARDFFDSLEKKKRKLRLP